MPKELNPNNPVVRQMSNQYHKLCAVLMVKFGVKEIEITPEDIAKLEGENNIVLDARNNQLWLRIVDDKTAQKLAREWGGSASAN